MTDNSREGWIEWAGGENPVGETRVQIRTRKHGELVGDAPGGDWGRWWQHENHDTDIIAYRIVTAADDRGDGNEAACGVVTPKPDELAIAVESDLDAVFNHVGPEDEVWVHGMTPQEIGDLTALGWEDQVETLLQDADELDKERKPGTAARVRFAARFIGQALSVRRARLSERQEGK